MSLQIPDVLSWDLDTVAGQVGSLRRDRELLLDSAKAIRSGRDTTIGEAEGDTATAAIRGCWDLARSISIIGHTTASIVDALAAFSNHAPGLRDTLLAAVEEAEAAGCQVADDGTVQGPAPTGSFSDVETRIGTHLRELEELDLAAANALNLIAMVESYDFYPHAPEHIGLDPVTTTAGVGLSEGSGLLGAAAKARGMAPVVAGSFPVIGTLASVTLGTATRSDGESIPESLAAEAVGVGSSMATGAAMGSFVPGAGTIGGSIVGGLVGVAGALGLRKVFAAQRADGKEDFKWTP